MLAAIQKAHYVDGWRVAELATLRDIASDIDFDDQAFDLAFSMGAAGEHITQTQGLMRSWSLQGYPGFVLDVGGRLLS